jgi:hypothetical protein
MSLLFVVLQVSRIENSSITAVTGTGILLLLFAVSISPK